MNLFYLLFIILNFYQVHCYFTRPGKCPENIKLSDDFQLAQFYDKWYQAYHYSSDLLPKSNCSILELQTEKNGIYLNQSRVDLGLFHRFSYGRLEIPKIEDSPKLNIVFVDHNAPRRLVTRKYIFYVLATNYNYYATVYTCQYSPLIDKHFMYVWILSRNKILNDVSKELAMKPLEQLGISEHDLVKDDLSAEKCTPKYYEEKRVEPKTFNTPVAL